MIRSGTASQNEEYTEVQRAQIKSVQRSTRSTSGARADIQRQSAQDQVRNTDSFIKSTQTSSARSGVQTARTSRKDLTRRKVETTRKRIRSTDRPEQDEEYKDRQNVIEIGNIHWGRLLGIEVRDKIL